MKNWQTKSSTVVYENPWISVREDQVVRPDGSDGIYGVISSQHPGVFVVPVDEDGNTYLVLQERYSLGRESWEIVAGSTEGQPAEEAAKWELLEEAGIKAGSIEKIFEFYSLDGISDHKAIVCLATDIQKVSDQLDESDGIMSVRKIPLTEVKDMIMRGEIVDGHTISAIMFTIEYLNGKK